MGTHYDTPESPLAGLVKAARQGPADLSCEQLQHHRAWAGVRRFGGHVVTARLVEPATGQVRDVLYPGGRLRADQLRDPKIRASHFGAPVGPDGFGLDNKHGAARYLSYQVVRRTPRLVVLEADYLKEAGVRFGREVWIGESYLGIEDRLEVSASRNGDEATSMVSHLYLNRGEVAPSADRPVTINGATLDDVLREKGAADRIMGGEARLWLGFAGPGAIITMPDGSQNTVQASYNGAEVDGALLWAPPDEEAFCFEPVVGVGPTLEDNRRLRIRAGLSGVLEVCVKAGATSD